jgi:hypothetical protein
MISALDHGPKRTRPAAPHITMPSESIEAASRPAASIFAGGAGTIAANIRIIGPTQVIIGTASSVSAIPGP